MAAATRSNPGRSRPPNRAPTAAAAIPDQTLIEGQTVSADIAGAFTDPDGDALNYAATSSDAGIAAASLSGTELSVTGVAAGAASITLTATDPGGLSASQSFAVEVMAATATRLTITPRTAAFTAIGQTIQLSAEVLDQLGRAISAPSVVWSSGDGSVVTVDLSGLVTAVGDGETAISATSGAVSDSARIHVQQIVQSIDVSPSTDTLTVLGDTLRLAAVVLDANGHAVEGADVTWSSSDPSVVTVDEDGLVTAVANGSADVRAVSGDVSGRASLVVSQTAAVVELSPATATLAPGETVLLAAVATDANGRTVPDATFGWTSSDPIVASVDDMGLVQALAEGMATIAAASGDAEGTAEITVRVDDTPGPGTWRGLVVAPEHRCTVYDPGDYRHPDALQVDIVAALDGRIYSPYTGIYYDDLRATSADHIVAKTEAHDSGGCAWSGTERRAFVHDIENLALAASSLDRGIKAANDAAEWLPDFNQCWYAGAIAPVRLKYELTVDEAERDALEEVLASCESTEMVCSPESWTIEAMTLGDESGWQVVSPHEPDTGALGIVGNMAVFCTPTFASADFSFIAGGARLEGGAGIDTRYTTLVPTVWLVPPPRVVEQIDVHQFPPWGTWTARIDGEQRSDFIVGLVLDHQEVSIAWPLPGDAATVIYQGGADDRREDLRDPPAV